MSVPPFVELPAGVTGHPVRTPRGTFAALDARGPNHQPETGTVLLVPGYTGSKEDFLAVLAPLAAAGHRLVAIDQRGQYESAGTGDPADYTLAALAEDVTAVADALGDGPVHLLGHSFGGLVCRNAVLAHPDRFRSLTLMSTGPAAVRPEQASRLRTLHDALLVTDLETIWAAMRQLDVEAGVDPPEDPRVAGFLHQRFVTTHPASLIAMGRVLLDTPDRVGELAALPLPKLVMRGTSDSSWPPAWQDAMARRLNAVRAVVLGAAHSPAAERPAATALALEEFWTAVEARHSAAA